MYALAMAASAALCAALYAARRHRAGLSAKGALAALLLGAALAFVLSKLFYFVLQLHYAWPRWGLGTLARMQGARAPRARRVRALRRADGRARAL